MPIVFSEDVVKQIAEEVTEDSQRRQISLTFPSSLYACPAVLHKFDIESTLEEMLIEGLDRYSDDIKNVR